MICDRIVPSQLAKTIASRKLGPNFYKRPKVFEAKITKYLRVAVEYMNIPALF